MKYISNFNKFFETAVANKPAPTKTPTKTPTKPKPKRPGKIVRPSVDPAPKAEDVADRFISLMNKKGEDVEKYTK